MARTNTSYHLAERPKPDLIPGKTFEKRTNPAPTADQLKDGEVLVEALYLSLDPAMRPMLNGALLFTQAVLYSPLVNGGLANLSRSPLLLQTSAPTSLPSRLAS